MSDPLYRCFKTGIYFNFFGNRIVFNLPLTVIFFIARINFSIQILAIVPLVNYYPVRLILAL